MLCTAVDVTEKRLFEVRLAAMAAQLGTAYQRFELALENSADHRLRAGRRPALHLHLQPAARHQRRRTSSTAPTPRSSPSATSARLAPRRSSGCWPRGGRENVEIEVEVGGELPLLRPDARGRRPTRTARSSGVLGTALDLTERRRDEQRMRLMMRELTHRSKNLLAVIQAMARKTASLSDDIDGFIADFSAAAARDGRGARPPRVAVLARRRPRRADPRQRRADHRARPPSRCAWTARR